MPCLVVIVLSFFLLPDAGLAQRLGYRLYTIDDGLVQSEVTRIHQDPMGFLWIGTKNGISRFDGYTFKTIKDSAGISESWILGFEQINDSTLFVATRKGYVLVKNRAFLETISGSFIDGSHIARWVDQDTLRIVTSKDDRFLFWNLVEDSLHVAESWLARYFAEMNVQKINGGFAFDPHARILYFRDTTGSLAAILPDHTMHHFPIDSFNEFIQGRDEKIYLSAPAHPITEGFRNHAVLYWGQFGEYGNNPVKIIQLQDTGYTQIFSPGNEVLAFEFLYEIETRKKLIFFSLYDSTLNFFQHGNITKRMVEKTSYTSILTDREGNVWMGGPHGLYRFYPDCFAFYDERDGLFDNLQMVLEDRHGRLITGSYDRGLQIYESGKFLALGKPDGLPSKNPVQIYPGGGPDRNGILHLCVNPYSAWLWDGEQLTLPRGLPVGSTMSYLDDTTCNRDIYGSNSGLIIRDRQTKQTAILPIFPGNKTNKAVALAYDDRERLWMGGFQGLTIMEGDSVWPLSGKKHEYSLGANALCGDQYGGMWIGNSNGLWHFRNDHFQPVSNPWFEDLVVSLANIGDSLLFIGSIHGTGFLDIRAFYREDTAIIRYFNKDNGFSGRECQQNAVCMDDSGFLWVATTNLLQRIDLKNLPTALPGPETYIQSVKVLDSRMNAVSLSANPLRSGILKLPYFNKNLKFEYTAIWFRGPAFVKFRYRLAGQDEGWSPPTQERSATYTNLSPGHYRFEVMAVNEYGNWTDEPAIIDIIIAPAFWQTWWFLLTTILLGILLVIYFTSLYFRKIRNKRQQELEHRQQIAELHFRTFRNQLAPHFIFNALNAIGSTIYRNEARLSYDLLHKFSRLIRATLVHADQTTRTLAEELEFVTYYLDIEKIRFEGKIDYDIRVAENVDLMQPIPRMIIQTFVENSVKHGLMPKEKGGQIEISVADETDRMRITVKDNGIGRRAAAGNRVESTGKGLEIIHELIRLFNAFNPGKITMNVADVVVDDVISGTVVTIYIPHNFSYKLIGDAKTENNSG